MAKKVNMELKRELREKGYTMRSNVNPDLIKGLKRWNKFDAQMIAEAIKSGDVKTAINHMSYAKDRNRQLREFAEHHDKLVFDASGKLVAFWDDKEQTAYEVE